VEKLEWQAPLRIIRYPDPRLRAVNARVGVFDESLKELSRQMCDVMYT
jgi:peptide deformylase